MNPFFTTPVNVAASTRLRSVLAALAVTLCVSGPVWAADTTPAEQLKRWTVEAGAPASAERGKVFFNARHGGEWSCASCHNAPPITEGKHANTGKVIAPLAPALTPKPSPRWPRWTSGSVATAKTCSAANAPPPKRPT